MGDNIEKIIKKTHLNDEAENDDQVNEKIKEGKKIIPVSDDYVNTNEDYMKIPLDFDGVEKQFLIRT